MLMFEVLSILVFWSGFCRKRVWSLRQQDTPQLHVDVRESLQLNCKIPQYLHVEFIMEEKGGFYLILLMTAKIIKAMFAVYSFLFSFDIEVTFVIVFL